MGLLGCLRGALSRNLSFAPLVTLLVSVDQVLFIALVDASADCPQMDWPYSVMQDYRNWASVQILDLSRLEIS